MFQRYAFVAMTSSDLARARAFWSDTLGFAVTEEKVGEYFIVDAGGLRLCVDADDGEVHRAGARGADPTIGLRVASLAETLARLEERGVRPEGGPVDGERGAHAIIRDPDGRAVVLTEHD